MLKRLRSKWAWGGGLGLVVVVAIIVVVALSGGDNEGEVAGLTDVERGPDVPIVIPPGEPIIVGVSIALTGAVGERGSEYRDAAIVGVERWKEANGPKIGGRDIEVVAEDDGCTQVEQTGIAARRLLRRVGLVAVIGPQCSSGVAAVASLYRNAAIVAISGSATTTSLTADQPEDGFFFRTAYRNDLEGTVIGLNAGIFGSGKAVIVDNGEIYGVDLARTATQALRENGASVTRLRIEQGTVDFSDLVARILEKKPEFVGYAGFNPEAALLYRQLRDAGYEGTFGASDGAASQSSFVEPVGEAAEGVVFAGCRYPLSDDVRSELTEVYNGEPSATFSAQYVDAATVILDAVAAVAREQDGELVIDPNELRDAVRATRLDGVSGPISFDVNGDRVPAPGDELAEVQDAALAALDAGVITDLGLVTCQVQDGQLVNVSGPRARELRLQ